MSDDGKTYAEIQLEKQRKFLIELLKEENERIWKEWRENK